LEPEGGFRFLWTCASRTSWHGVLPEVYPLRLRIAVPFLNQIRQTLSTAVRGTEPVAAITLAEPVENVVTLQNPDPASPRVLRGTPDDRELALAIAIYPWVPSDGAGG
jgi:hypothetical protein